MLVTKKTWCWALIDAIEVPPATPIVFANVPIGVAAAVESGIRMIEGG